MIRPSHLAAAVLGGLAFTAAHADTVVLDGFTYGSAPAVHLSGASLPYPNVYAGEYSGTWNGASFGTYCTDIFQAEAGWHVTATDYSLVDGTAAWGAQKSADLDRLFSAASTLVTDKTSSAVFQAAVWEVLNETTVDASGHFVYDFASGSFSVTSGDTATQSLLTSADPAWALLSAQPITVHVNQLHSDKYQDFMAVTAVPEPSTCALLAAGLGWVGFVSRRRQAA